MAGDLDSASVHWNVGDSVGHDDAGQSATIPGPAAQAGSGVPSGAPTGLSPFYVNTDNHKLFAWTGTAWVAISGANT